MEVAPGAQESLGRLLSTGGWDIAVVGRVDRRPTREFPMVGQAPEAYCVQPDAARHLINTLEQLPGWVPVEDLLLAGLGNVGPGLVGGMVLGVLGGAIAAGVMAAKRGTAEPRTPVIGDFDSLVPVTREQRRWFAAMALTAGICEEVVFRGFLTFYVAEVLPGASALVVIGVAAAVFALAHAYQGAAGVVGTFGMGLLFGVVYLATGSLLPGMVLHALVDLRLLVGARRRGEGAESGRRGRRLGP